MLLTVKKLQKTMRIGRDTAYALMHSSGFPSMKIGGRYFVTEDALKMWLEKQKYKSYVL